MKQIKNNKVKVVALFGYPMDNSVRAKVFNTFSEVQEDAEKWKNISYLIVAFPIMGDILINE